MADNQLPLLLLIPDPLEPLESPPGNYRVMSASSPAEGLQRALLHSPDLILVSGVNPELLAQLRAPGCAEQAAVLVVTGQADQARRLELLRGGADDVLSSDSTEELGLKLQSLLSSRLAARRSAHEFQALVYAISHDLQAPLRAVSGFSEALLTDYSLALNPEGKHLLERVSANAQRLTLMLEGLLELSRLFRDPQLPRPIDLSAMAGEILEKLRLSQPERSLEASIAPGLTVSADPRLTRVLLEKLLDNAWKFTAHKSPARIEFDRTSQGFYLKDNGVGFNLEYAQRLFTPFQRLHGREFAGIGMGLAIAERIVSRGGGRIWADSSPEGGATFLFTLQG